MSNYADEEAHADWLKERPEPDGPTRAEAEHELTEDRRDAKRVTPNA